MSNKDKEMELLSAYIDGELGEEEKNKVSSFLAHSPEARKSLERLKHTKKLLMNMPAIKAPESFLDSLERQAVQAMEREEVNDLFWRRTNVWAWASPVMAAAAVVAIAVGIHTPSQIPYETLLAAHDTAQVGSGVHQNLVSASHYSTKVKGI